jgi:integrase
MSGSNLGPPTPPRGLRERRGKWHYRFTAAGTEYTGSTGLKATERNLTAAMRKLETARRLVESGEPESLRLRPKPFSDAAVMFIDWARGEYKAHPATATRLSVSMVSCRAYFDGTPLHAVTAGELEDYKAWRRSCGIREVTLRHDLHALSLLYQYGARQHWCRRNPVKDVTIPSDREATRQHVLTAQEEAAYLSAIPKATPLYDAARLILATGMRPEEVLRLCREDVDLAAGTVFVKGGKTAAARRLLRLSPDSLLILRYRMMGPRHLFPGRGDGQKRLNSAHDRALDRWNGAHPDRKLTHVLYDLRHTFATRMAEAGCPLATLAAILGHSNLRTIHRYVHPSQEAMDRALLVYGRSEIGPGQVSQAGVLEGPAGQVVEINGSRTS